MKIFKFRDYTNEEWERFEKFKILNNKHVMLWAENMLYVKIHSYYHSVVRSSAKYAGGYSWYIKSLKIQEVNINDVSK